MKVLNLYAEIGGNRLLWSDEHQIIAVENNKDIAKIYKDNFPNDLMLVCDAHDFLLNNFEQFDFIWSSPPCPTHSPIRKHLAVGRGQNEPVFPDMELYEEIIFLKNHFKGKWVVENVIGYYEPLIKPYEVANHYFWANFHIGNIKVESREHNSKVEELQKRKGFDLTNYNIDIEKKLLLRNCVEPEVGLHILQEAIKEKQKKLTGGNFTPNGVVELS